MFYSAQKSEIGEDSPQGIPSLKTSLGEAQMDLNNLLPRWHIHIVSKLVLKCEWELIQGCLQWPDFFHVGLSTWMTGLLQKLAAELQERLFQETVSGSFQPLNIQISKIWHTIAYTFYWFFWSKQSLCLSIFNGGDVNLFIEKVNLQLSLIQQKPPSSHMLFTFFSVQNTVTHSQGPPSLILL